MNPEWWVWIVGGIALVLAELIIPSFFIVWFGLAALLVGLLSFLTGMANLAGHPSVETTDAAILGSLSLTAGAVMLWRRVPPAV